MLGIFLIETVRSIKDFKPGDLGENISVKIQDKIKFKNKYLKS